jgi:hypothetical protein
MCDQIPSLECPECAYQLPDEHDIDDGYEMDRPTFGYCITCEHIHCICPDPDLWRDEQLLLEDAWKDIE